MTPRTYRVTLRRTIEETHLISASSKREAAARAREDPEDGEKVTVLKVEEDRV